MAQQTPSLFMWHKDSTTRAQLKQKRLLINQSIVRFEMPVSSGAQTIIDQLRQQALIANTDVDQMLYTTFHHFCVEQRYNKHLFKTNKKQAWLYLLFLEEQGYEILPVFYGYMANILLATVDNKMTIKDVKQLLSQHNKSEQDYVCQFVSKELRATYCQDGPLQSSCLSSFSGGQLACGATAYKVLRIAYPQLIPKSYFLIAPGPVQVADIAASASKKEFARRTNRWQQTNETSFSTQSSLMALFLLLKLRLALEARCHWKRAELAPLNAFSTALRKLALLEDNVATPQSSPQFNQPQFVHQLKTCLEHPHISSRLRKGKTYRHLTTIKAHAEQPMPSPNSPIQMPSQHWPSVPGTAKTRQYR